MNKTPTTLADVLEHSWVLLKQGVDKPDSPMRIAVLATSSDVGCEMRSVILREFLSQRRVIQCHTDARSPKVAEIRACARVQWVFFDPVSRVQLRATGPASVHCNADWVEAIWDKQHPRSRQIYLVDKAPGTPSEIATGGFTQANQQQEPNYDNTSPGRENFAVIEGRIERLDWLHLGKRANTRARFEWDGETLLSTWLTP